MAVIQCGSLPNTCHITAVPTCFVSKVSQHRQQQFSQHQLSWFSVFAVFLFVLDSSFQRTVSSHSLPKHHVQRIPVFISLHFRATFLPFLHLRPSTQHLTQPSIAEISRSPSPTNHTKQLRKYYSLPPPPQKKKSQKDSTTHHHDVKKKPRKYAYFCDFLLAAILGDLFDNRSE